MKIKLAMPSLRRAVVCIAVAAIFACVWAGAFLYTGAILTLNHPTPSPNPPKASEYVLLLIVDIAVWGPIALLVVWQISVPVIVAIGTLVACIRSVDPPSGPAGEAETAADSPPPTAS